MIDTGITLAKASELLKNRGAKNIYAFCTHGLFSDEAFEIINNSLIDKLVVTNTIPKKKDEEKCDKIIRLSVGSLLAEAIRRS